jgi:hypothetical protein
MPTVVQGIGGVFEMECPGADDTSIANFVSGRGQKAEKGNSALRNFPHAPLDLTSISVRYLLLLA